MLNFKLLLDGDWRQQVVGNYSICYRALGAFFKRTIIIDVHRLQEIVNYQARDCICAMPLRRFIASVDFCLEHQLRVLIVLLVVLNENVHFDDFG